MLYDTNDRLPGMAAESLCQERPNKSSRNCLISGQYGKSEAIMDPRIIYNDSYHPQTLREYRWSESYHIPISFTCTFFGGKQQMCFGKIWY